MAVPCEIVLRVVSVAGAIFYDVNNYWHLSALSVLSRCCSSCSHVVCLYRWYLNTAVSSYSMHISKVKTGQRQSSGEFLTRADYR